MINVLFFFLLAGLSALNFAMYANSHKPWSLGAAILAGLVALYFAVIAAADRRG